MSCCLGTGEDTIQILKAIPAMANVEAVEVSRDAVQ